MKRMKTAVLPLALALAVLLAGCGANASNSTVASPAAGGTMMEADYNGVSFDTAASPAEGEELAGSSSVYQNTDAKLVRRANLNVQTTQFDQAAAELEDMVSRLGGYFQSAAVYGGSYRNANANRIGEYTIRVPAERYEQCMSQTGDLGYVTYKNETTDNIGEQYYDTQARLKTQQTKQERLLVLMEQAETMEDIISLESALSDVEYQIEQLTSTLNSYDSLVSFATISLTLEEVYEVTEETGVTASLGERMAAGVARSGDSLVQGCQELLVWISYHIFGLLILAAAAVGAVVAARHMIRRRKKRGEGNSLDETKKGPGGDE